jgi:hypothetical protein
MTSSLSAVTIVFVACHGGPADHFSVLSQQLPNSIVCAAQGPAENKFLERKITPLVVFDLQSKEQAIADIMKVAKTAHVVITDVGHEFSATIHETLERDAKEVVRIAWYDNPERFVPGYSPTAAKVMKNAECVWFSNANLADGPVYQKEEPYEEMDFTGITRVGIGYYPIDQAQAIARLRSQRMVAYMGGNNEEYFSKVFPAFLTFLTEAMETKDLSQLTFLLQQHPGAKKENRDGLLLEAWNVQNSKHVHEPKLQMSTLSQQDVQTKAHAVMYWQTSMSPQFMVAGIPAIQVGHRVFEDTLVRNKKCDIATSTEEFLRAVGKLVKEVSPEEQAAIEQIVGIKTEWITIRNKALQDAIASKNV